VSAALGWGALAASSLVLGALLFAPVTIPKLPDLVRNVSLAPALAAIGLAVICTALAFVLFFALIAEVGPARATVITYVNPAVAIILGALVLKEPLTTGMMIGFPLVIIGSFLGTTRGSAATAPEPAR